MKLTLGKIVDRIVEIYSFAKNEETVCKPWSWTLYRVWKWVDNHEQRKGEE
jgi:hypothetical protein